MSGDGVPFLLDVACAIAECEAEVKSAVEEYSDAAEQHRMAEVGADSHMSCVKIAEKSGDSRDGL